MTQIETQATPEPVQKRPFFRVVLASLPTLAVLIALAAVGIWGHRTGWKAPKLSDLFGKASEAPREDWCTEHNVRESQCIACHPELTGESAADWCKEHGVPESKCTICHPEILKTGVAADWCKEHGLPESGCTICHPEIVRKGDLPRDPNATTVIAADTASRPASRPDPATCQTHLLRVQFASKAALEKAGVRLGQVIERPMSDSVMVNAEVDYDRTRFARLTSRVQGIAWRVVKNVGEPVRAGDVLAFIDSAEVGRAKAEYLQATAAVEVTTAAEQRVQRSSEAGFRTAGERLEIEARAREARIRLFNARQAMVNLGFALPEEPLTQESITTLGIPESIRSTLPSGALSANLFPLLAPFEGTVVSRPIVMGQVVDHTTTLFEIADLSRMWITMHVSPSDLRRVALGQRVIFKPDETRDDAVSGTIHWISTAVDEVSRMVEVRAEVANASGILRAHSFGSAQIVVRNSADTVAVPNEALQWEGCCHIVFVRLTDEIFQTRKVRLGAKDAAYTEVTGGVVPGEVIVTAGSHVLKSEILKSNLGAGCCEDK